jgi:SnoaL-like domain
MPALWFSGGVSPADDATILRRTSVEIWELVAREHIRDTLARYNWSGDAGRLDELADTFCVDGVLEIRGVEPLRGRAEIVAFLSGVKRNVAVGADVKPIVRHNVANVLFTAVTRDEAQVSCYFTVVTHIGLDHVGRYRDTLVPDGGIWRIKHRKVSTDWAAPDSAMAR